MTKYYILIAVGFLLTFLLACAIKKSVVVAHSKTKEEQINITPLDALNKLKQGNERFLNRSMRKRDFVAQILSSESQFPFAIILNCMDSRGSPEIIFDQGIGDIFVERLAGNVVNVDVLAGMEYATKISGAKLIVVLGHTSCGAVKGACDGVKLGNLTKSLKKIEPSVALVRKQNPAASCQNDVDLNAMAQENVRRAIEQIKADSPVIMELIAQGKVALVGGMHDLSTGKVTFFE